MQVAKMGAGRGLQKWEGGPSLFVAFLGVIASIKEGEIRDLPPFALEVGSSSVKVKVKK